MTVTLAPEWGGATVAGLVAEALAVSQAVAARRDARQIDLADLVIGLLSLPDDALRRVLSALPVDRARLAVELFGRVQARVVMGPTAAGPPAAGPDVLAVIARAKQWGGDCEDGAIGLRLLGEVAGTPSASVRPLRDAGIGTDRLRWAAARCGVAFDLPAAPVAPLRPPATPTLAELREHRPNRRSAAVSSVMRQLMPANDSVGTPYGMVRNRRWALAQIIYLCVRPLAALAIIVFGIRTHSWWAASSILLAISAEFAPLALFVTSYAALTVIAGLMFPWPLIVLVLICAAADGIGFWYQWWMKRVDAGDPALPASAIRRGAVKQGDHLLAAWRLERARGR